MALEIGGISGAQQQLLAYRHYLEWGADNLHALIQHTRCVERDWKTTVGPALKMLNPRLAGGMRDHIGAARRLAENLTY